MRLFTLFQRKFFTNTEKEREGRRVPLSYLISPRDWAGGGPGLDTAQSARDGSGCREIWGLDAGMAQGPSAGLISPSVLLTHPSKPAQCPAHCCHLQLCREVSWETSCGSATAGLLCLHPIFHSSWGSSHCGIDSVSWNSACSLSLLSLEIHVLAHPLE